MGESTMVDMTDVAGGLSALKTASEIVQALLGIRDAKAFGAKAFELQRVLLEAHGHALAAYTANAQCAERVRQLERRLAEMENWEREQQRYELKEFPGGALAYAVKEAMRGEEPAHYLCAGCMQNGKKSILQGHTSGFGGHHLACNACKLDIVRGSDPALPPERHW